MYVIDHVTVNTGESCLKCLHERLSYGLLSLMKTLDRLPLSLVTVPITVAHRCRTVHILLALVCTSHRYRNISMYSHHSGSICLVQKLCPLDMLSSMWTLQRTTCGCMAPWYQCFPMIFWSWRMWSADCLFSRSVLNLFACSEGPTWNLWQ